MDFGSASRTGYETRRRAFVRGALASGAAVRLAAAPAGAARAAGRPAANAPAAAGEPMYVYVGTFTGPNLAEGLSIFRLEGASGALTHLATVPADNPSFLALH